MTASGKFVKKDNMMQIDTKGGKPTEGEEGDVDMLKSTMTGKCNHGPKGKCINCMGYKHVPAAAAAAAAAGEAKEDIPK
jgi:hypothetical protein